MTAHSKIGASSMERWSKCPGSVALSKDIPSGTSVYAEEGTLAHELAANILQRQTALIPHQEMLDHVHIYTEFVASLPGELFVEKRLHLAGLHPDLFGTADAIVYDAETQTLYVVDLKYGAGISVEVVENVQLLYYALAALLMPELRGHSVRTITTVIVQPRCFHEDGPVRRWTFPVSRMIDFALDLVDAAKATEAADAPLVPGDHCRFCPAKGVCPKLHETAVTTAQEEFKKELSYSPEKLSKTLTLIPAIEAWAKGVRQFAYAEAIRGRTPPGFKLVEKRATRKWAKDEDVVREALRGLVKTYPDDLYEERTLLSPPKMEERLGNGGKKLIKDLVVSESSGVTLAPESDKRKQIHPGSEFSKFPLLPDASGDLNAQTE